MIFLDTCIWIELSGVRTPIKEHEIHQATAASELLEQIYSNKEPIITCKEQLIEIINAVEKVTMRAINRERKENGLPGIGNLKKFRQLEEFQNVKDICESVISDVFHFASIHSIGDYQINDIIQRLELADINDCLYYDFCVKEKIHFYTFDMDLQSLGESEYLHCI